MNCLLIGKQNVGKSSIYNILSQTNSNIVHNVGGTTRDWHVSELYKFPNIYIYDCPGISFENKINIFETNNIFKNLLKKIDLFLYVIDYKSIFNQDDYNFLNKLRTYNKKIILLINKFDNFQNKPNNEYYKYAIDNTFFLSCSHKYGFSDLIDYLKTTKIKTNTSKIKFDNTIAIFGKPNVGKSTFLNNLLGYQRSNTNKIAGTTSDHVISDFYYKKKHIKIIDTAGIQKKSKIIKKSLNYYTTKKTFENLIKIDLAIILLDSSEGMNRQDKNIINIVTKKAANVIIVFNKIDLIKNKKLYIKENILNITEQVNQLYNVKIFFISALLKKDIKIIIEYIYKQILSNKHEFKTNLLNSWLKKAVNKKNHPLVNKKRINFKYVVQINNNPIIIKIFCNFANKIRKDYRKYLINNFNKNFKILNRKTILKFSKEKNPYI